MISPEGEKSGSVLMVKQRCRGQIEQKENPAKPARMRGQRHSYGCSMSTVAPVSFAGFYYRIAQPQIF